MSRRCDLGRITCPHCQLIVDKIHPAQKICGEHKCRLASKRKYEGITFECDHCGQTTQRKRSNQRFCSSAECQRRSKQGARAKKVKVTCPYCETTVVARNTRQVTCLSETCKALHAKAIRNRNRTKKRTGETFKCRFCPTVVERLQENQVTCGGPECRKRRKKQRDDESFWLQRRRAPKLCGVCDRPLRVKRFRYHPKCRKQLANDKRRVKRNLEKVRAEKLEALRSIKTRRKRRVSTRMEELKCVSKPLRTS